MGYQRERSLLMPFLTTGVWPCRYTLEEDVVVRCDEKNQSGWPEWHQSQVFSWYYVRAKTNQLWHGCSIREDPLATDADTGSVVAAERWDSAMVRFLLFSV